MAYQPGQPALFYEVDIAALADALATAQALFGIEVFEDAQRFFLGMILWAAHDGFSVDEIIEAIVLGTFTGATQAEMETHTRELTREEARDELQYCRMRSSMGTDTGFHLDFDECVLGQTGETVEELFGAEADNESDQPSEDPTEDGDNGSAGGSSGLGANQSSQGPTDP